MSANTIDRIDLHTHTACSDGLLEPRALVERAADQGVTVLSITDHDTVAAYEDPNLFSFAADRGVRLVPGIEFSATETDGARAHILGLGINVASPGLRTVIELQESARKTYTDDVCEKLQTLGWKISSEELFAGEQHVVTKAHIAREVLAQKANHPALLQQFGEIPNAGTFIETVMIKGCPAYVALKDQLTAKKAVASIHDAGGVAIFAHPVAHLYESETSLKALENQIRESGVDGLEAYYIYYAKKMGDKKVNAVEKMLRIADHLGIAVTGGSDFHGDAPEIGNFVELGFKNEDLSVPVSSLDILNRHDA